MIFEGKMHQLYCDWAQVNVYSNGSGSAEAAAAVDAANAADTLKNQRKIYFQTISLWKSTS